MITEKINRGNVSYEKSVSRVAEILQKGGIVAIPTETVYGLAASAYDENAIKNIFIAKGRPQDNPLIVHICDMDMLEVVAKDIPQKAYMCAQKFWPGPFTMVLQRTDKTAECVSAGLKTVAVRMPLDKTAIDIIKKSGLPLAAPSANVSGKPSPTSALHVESDLDGVIDAIFYGDECEVGVESTVVSFTEEPPRLLRPGAVTLEQLKEIIPDIAVDSAVLAEPQKDKPVASPGMKYKHYAPKTECFLIEAESKDFCDFVNLQTNSAAICFNEEKENITVSSITYGSYKNGSTLAQGLFAALRNVDSLNAEKVYIHAPDKTGVGLAVYNRLIRAAAFKVIKL